MKTHINPNSPVYHHLKTVAGGGGGDGMVNDSPWMIKGQRGWT